MSGRHLSGPSADLTGTRSLAIAIRRNWWVMVTVIPLCIALILTIDKLTPDRFEATATVVIEDPRASSFFELSESARPSSQDSERYLADQVEILRSGAAAEIASAGLDGRLSSNDLLEQSTIEGDADSNTVTIAVVASDPDLARRATDEIALAYEQILAERNQATIESAVNDIEELLENIDADIASVTSRIDTLLAADADFQELLVQYEEALATFNDLRRSREESAVGSPERIAINDQIAELLRDFTTWQVIFETDRADQELSSLVAQRDALVAERARLTAQRNAIASSSSAGLGGIVLRSPATEPEAPTGPRPLVLVVLAAVLGSGLAIVGAEAIESRRADLSTSTEVLSSLEAPLLATVTDIANAASPVPVIDDPSSAYANRLRFAATALDIRASAADARSILIVGPHSGVGATTIVANVGAALATSGLRVLVVDADLNDQQLSGIFSSGDTPGITDVVTGAIRLSEAITSVDVGGEVLHVLGRGTLATDVAAVARSGDAEKLVGQATTMFDLVLIDTAPLLDAAYVSSLARNVDAVAFVLDARTKTAEVEEMKQRVDLIGTNLLGYFLTDASYRSRGLLQQVGAAVRRPQSRPQPAVVD